MQLDDDGRPVPLRSLDDPDLRFLVVPPATFFPDYAPVVDDDVVADLGIEDVAEVLVLVILTAGDSLAETTANLLGPVLVNTATRRGLPGRPRRPVAVDRPARPGLSPGVRPALRATTATPPDSLCPCWS